ncbi:MAG: hypothetical protein KDK23_02760 [Leptospiraceae bacterium]|nr:hypothetical protein [Leptospiraceae bacterium]
MKKLPNSLWILLASLVALGAFLFLDLDRKDEPMIWDLKLQTIRYGDLSFEKETSFKGESYYTSLSIDGKSYRYRASTTVPNLFRDLEELKMQGLYVFDDQIKELFPEDPFAASEKTRCLELEPASDAAFKLCALREDKGGKVFAVANRPENAEEAYLIAGYTLDRLDADRASFLEKRVFLYPTASSTVEMEISLQGILDESASFQPFSADLFRREKKQDDRTIMVWKDSSGREVSPQFSNPLDTVIRQYQVEFFDYEYDIDTEAQWEASRPLLTAKMVAGQDGEEVQTMRIEVRNPAQPLTVKDKQVLLMKSPEMEGVQLIDLETVKRTIGYIQGVQAELASQPPGESSPAEPGEDH